MDYVLSLSIAFLVAIGSTMMTFGRPLNKLDQEEILKQKEAILLKVIEDMKELVVSIHGVTLSRHPDR